MGRISPPPAVQVLVAHLVDDVVCEYPAFEVQQLAGFGLLQRQRVYVLDDVELGERLDLLALALFSVNVLGILFGFVVYGLFLEAILFIFIWRIQLVRNELERHLLPVLRLDLFEAHQVLKVLEVLDVDVQFSFKSAAVDRLGLSEVVVVLATCIRVEFVEQLAAA